MSSFWEKKKGLPAAYAAAYAGRGYPGYASFGLPYPAGKLDRFAFVCRRWRCDRPTSSRQSAPSFASIGRPGQLGSGQSYLWMMIETPLPFSLSLSLSLHLIIIIIFFNSFKPLIFFCFFFLFFL
ncbi:Uncharacterized protein APZ42_024632, partial [Daphnia magna]